MDIELLQIRDFLAQHRPFDLLSVEVLNQVAQQLEVRYYRHDSKLLEANTKNEHLYIVRTGAVELRDQDKNLVARLSEGEIFGHDAIQKDGLIKDSVQAIEDVLIYRLSKTFLDQLCHDHPQIDFFFNPIGAERLREAMAFAEPLGQEIAVSRMSVPVSELLEREPVSIDTNATVQEAAVLMTQKKVSSLLVVNKNDRLVGVMTDRDLRCQVFALPENIHAKVEQIMTRDPITIRAERNGCDAMLKMIRHNIHHLPVVENDKVLGMITTTNLERHHSTSPIHLVGRIHKRNTPTGLKETVTHVPDLIVNMVAFGVNSHNFGKVIAAIYDAIAIRLLQLAEARLGPPPVSYAWLAAGSQARLEQNIQSDQDNVLLLDDTYDPKKHQDYFKRLSRFVCDGLNTCGQVYCPGEVMATTARWCQPFRVWDLYFRQWINEPSLKALMLSSVFFDMRCLYGSRTLFKRLQHTVLRRAKNNKIFLAYMVSNAMKHNPPLGFFRNFVLSHDDEHRDTLDLKHNGVVPIVDLARIYALDAGSDAINTYDRLTAAQESRVLSREGAQDLQGAFDLIQTIRLNHHARCIKNDQPINNYVPIEDLSNFERSHLRDAFSIVKTLQSALSMRYQGARFP
ncbi:putative nucleotidyltransferase substrate binding domain-containing protein [Magnetococcales bacterium HHB-1]